MFQTSLAAALLAASTGSAAPDSLLALMPPDADGVLLVGDMTNLVESDDPPAWIALFLDERMSELFVELDDDEELPYMDAAGRVLRAIEGGAGAAFSDENDWNGAVFALQVTDDFMPAIEWIAELNEEELVESDVLGASGYRMLVDTPDEVALVEIDGTMLVGSGEREGFEPALRAVVDAMTGEGETERWWDDVDIAGVSDPLVEFWLNFDFLAEEDPEFADVFDAGLFAYFGAGVGDGQEGEICVAGSFGAIEEIEALTGSFGDANVDLLRLAPPDSFAASALNVDINGVVDAILDLVDDTEASAMYDAAMEAGSATLGVDIQDEIFGNMTGDILLVQWPTTGIGMDSEDPEDLAEAAPAIAIAIEDSEPFYTMIETIETQLGPDGVEVEESDVGTLWTTEPLPGIRISAGLSETMFFLGTEERVEDLMDRAASEAKAGLLDADQFAFAEANLDGFVVAAQDLGSTWELLETAMELSGEEVPAELMTVIDVLADHLTGFALAELRISATEVSYRMITR